jgi:hypothetical protein
MKGYFPSTYLSVERVEANHRGTEGMEDAQRI